MVFKNRCLMPPGLSRAWLLLLVMDVGVGQAQPPASSIRFEDRTQEFQLAFEHHNGSSGRRYLMEAMGAGVACFDADNDGWLDIYLLNGAALPGTQYTSPPTNALFRNLRGKKFAEVTRVARCQDFAFGLGVVAADYDNDGFVDLYITNFGPNRLLHNNGDGTFADVTDSASVADGSKFSAGATFVDIDQDGNLDLFSANYVEFSYAQHDKLAPAAYPYAPGPHDFPPAADTLYLNQGDGTFADISTGSGVASIAGPSMGVIAGDFDGDGDSDIFVACDGAPNLYFVNDGQGKFTEQALFFGLAYDLRGNANGNMGVEAADLDGDELEDLFVTNYADQLPTLFKNTGLGVFQDVTRISQISSEVFPHVTWGAGLVDFDSDGDRDVFICSGHLLENAKQLSPETDYGVPNTVMENLGGNTYRSVTAAVGSALTQALSSRGAVFDDLDNDGDIDCVVLNCAASAQLLINTTKSLNHWIEIELRGRHCNRDAIGSQVRIRSGKTTQVAEVHNGRGYQSQYGQRLHFGLGQAASIDWLEIVWAGGDIQVLERVTADRILTIVQP